MIKRVVGVFLWACQGEGRICVLGGIIYLSKFHSIVVNANSGNGSNTKVECMEFVGILDNSERGNDSVLINFNNQNHF